MEYACLNWNPFYECYKYDLQRIQNKKARYIFFRENKYYNQNNSSIELCNIYNLESLEKRRSNITMVYLFKLLNGLIDDPLFLSKLSFNVPVYRTRNTLSFYLPYVAYNNRHLNSPLFSMCNLYNKLQDDVDIFNITLFQLKNFLKQM